MAGSSSETDDGKWHYSMNARLMNAVGGWGNATNLMALVAIQGANAIFPLIIYPYLLHVVGVAHFSGIVWTEALNFIVLSVVMYSFDVDGVKRLTDCGGLDDAMSRSEVFYAIFWSRLILLAVASALVLCGVALFVPAAFVLSSFWLLLVAGQVFQSSWFYLAIEKNQFMASITVLIRIVGAVLIMLYIREPGRYYVAPLLIGGSYLVSGVLAFVWATRRHGMVFHRPNVATIYSYLKSGRHIFSGNISVVLFRGSNVFVLKLFSLDTAVSEYAIAEKMIKCVQSAIRPVNQFAYPKVIRDFGSAARLNQSPFNILMRHTRGQLIVVFLLWVFVFSGLALYLTLGFSLSGLSGGVFLLMGIMAPAVLFGVCNYMFGTVGLNNINLANYYAKAVFATGVTTVLISLLLVIAGGSYGASAAYTFGELFLCILVVKKILKSRNHFAMPVP